MKDYSDFGIEIPFGRKSGHIKTFCPKCRDRRHDKRDRSLSVDLDNGVWKCHYCEWVGGLPKERDHMSSLKYQKKEYVKPALKGSALLSEKVLRWFSDRGISMQTLTKMKITEGKEWMPQKGKEVNTIQFNYYLNGELINTKFRTGDKCFKLVSNAELIPYNLDAIKGTNTAIITEGECFRGDAEILTSNGFVRFDEYQGEDVAVVDDRLHITFKQPLARIEKPYDGDLIEFKSKYYYSLTTPGHNMVFRNKTTKEFFKKTAEELEATKAANWDIPCALRWTDSTGVDISDEMLAFYIAVSADFTIRPWGALYGAIKKPRKIVRLVDMLNKLGIEYSLNRDSRGYASFYIRPKNVPQGVFKLFPKEWIGKLSTGQCRVILREIVHWDGNWVKGKHQIEYSSKEYHNASFIQTIAHMAGYKSTIIKRQNAHGSWYKVSILFSKNHVTTQSLKKQRVYHKGLVYCVQVDTGKIVVRQNGIVSVTGNCDTLSFIECGREDVISVPNGANANLSYLDDYLEEYFDDKETIYIASDTDTKGVMLRNELLRRFGPERCKVVEYGEGCKDANEHLVKYGKESLLKCLEDATEPKIEGVFAVEDVEKNLDLLYRKGLQRGYTIGFENFDELCSFETKRLCILTGVPSCLDGDTLVDMADGSRKRMADVQVGEYIQTLTEDYYITNKPIINKWDSGEKECYELITRDGHKIVATGEHRFLTFDGWKQLKDIKAGEFIGSPVGFNGGEQMNEDMLKLLAVWMGDGSKGKTTYTFTNDTPEVIDEVKAICKRNNLRYHQGVGYQHTVCVYTPLKVTLKKYKHSMACWYKKQGYPKEVAIRMAINKSNEKARIRQSLLNPYQELKDLGMYEMNTYTLRVPNKVMRLSNDQVAIFLNMLFACDGSFYKGRIESCSVSYNLCKDIQSLLSRFDICSTIREKQVKYKDERRPAFTLNIDAYDSVYTFVKMIGITGKQDRMNDYIKNHKPNIYKTDYIPSSIKEKLTHGKKFYKKHLGIIMSMNQKSKVRVNRKMVIDCARLQEDGEQIIAQLNRGCRWKEIKSITPVGKRQTYDMEIADTHNFFANGIVTHNSGKSAFLNFIAIRMNMLYDWKFAFFSPESMPIDYQVSTLIEIITGKKFGEQTMPWVEYEEAKKYCNDNFFFIYPETYTLGNILDKARSLVRRKGIKALVIDPYNRVESEQDYRKSETQHISSVLDQLTNFAQQNDVLVFLMAHPTKMPKNPDGKFQVPTLYDISGSANFYNKADFGITIHRDKEFGWTEVHVQKVKYRHLGQGGMTKFKYNLRNSRYVPLEDGIEPHWDNENYLAQKANTLTNYTMFEPNTDFDNDLPF